MVHPVYVLGIHDGHNSTAALVADGVVVAAVQEERITRRKNEIGYPRLAIEDCLRIAGIDSSQLAAVTYASNFMHRAEHLSAVEPWYRVGLSQQRLDAQRPHNYDTSNLTQRQAERIDEVQKHLRVRKEQISFVEHHLAHLASAYYTAPVNSTGRPVLGLTCDGAGDNIAGTVSVCRDNNFERIATTDRHASLGKIYSRVTLMLGMKPWEHEYKVMGLAPYCDTEHAQKAADVLRSLIRLDDTGLKFVQCGELSTNYCYEYLRDGFEATRFDTVAGATQLFTEELLTSWVRAAIKHTGISDIVCGGGVFMNVKANLAIAALPEVTSLYVVPSAGDESLAFGAALHQYYAQSGRRSEGDSVFANLYLGGDYSRSDEVAAVGAYGGNRPFDVLEGDVDQRLVDLLAKGEVVASARGRMEWGARALGNRSILSSGENLGAIELLNNKIKQRDFWMPFAPSIRAESAHRYMAERKGLHPYFMMLAYEGTDEAQRDLKAAMHPRDQTLRPQVVTQTMNPRYHSVLTAFEKRTGRGGLLNTSFNLHGEPIVYSPADAIDVFMRSGLEHLALDSCILTKRKALV